MIDAVKQPWLCFDLPKDECRRTYGCEWTYRGKGFCRPKYALKPIRDIESAREAVERVVETIENVPPKHLMQAWFEGKYLVATLPHSPTWSNVPWDVRWWLLTEGKERVYDAYYRRAQQLGLKTRIRPVEVRVRR